MVQVIFIIGTSGAGKTTLVKELRKCEMPSYRIYDFDEMGVPQNADVKWRQEQTQTWLQKAIDNQEKSLSTIICGVCVPHEIQALKSFHRLNISYLFLEVDYDTICDRLHKRGWNDALIQDNLNWAEYLKKEVLSAGGQIINNNDTIDKLVQKVTLFIKKT